MTAKTQQKATSTLLESVDKKTQFDPVKTGRIISLVLHPFLVAPIGIVLILWLDTGSLLTALGWAALCAAFVVAPASIYLFQKLRKRQYTDADVSVREHRYGFYLFGGACMVLCFGVLLWLDAPTALIAGFVAALAALVIAAAVNRYFTKISIHAGAMVGVAMAVVFYAPLLSSLLLVAAAALTWARLITQRHTPTEALAAWIVASCCVIGVFGTLI